MSTTSSFPDILSRDLLLAWPKAELHCHLDGSLRLETLLDLARAQGKLGILPAAEPEPLAEALRQIDDSPTLEAYLAWFRYTIPVLQSADALRRAAYELVEDNAREQVRYVEVRYSPILHVDEGLTIEAVNDAVLDGLRAAEQDFGTRTGLIVCGLRDRPESVSLRLAELAVAYRGRGVVGFDLAGGEAGFPPKHHLAAFYYARNHLLNLTIHAGESWGPDSIHQALFRCGAHRIGHGTSLYRDPDLLAFVVDHRIPLEICPTSNVQTHVVDAYEAHPLRRYVDAGAPVTINTDNRLFSRTTLTEELWRAHTRCGVPADRMPTLVLDAFRHAFLPYDERRDLVLDAAERIAARSPSPTA